MVSLSNHGERGRLRAATEGRFRGKCSSFLLIGLNPPLKTALRVGCSAVQSSPFAAHSGPLPVHFSSIQPTHLAAPAPVGVLRSAATPTSVRGRGEAGEGASISARGHTLVKRILGLCILASRVSLPMACLLRAT